MRDALPLPKLVVFDLACIVANHANAVFNGMGTALRTYGMRPDRDACMASLGLSPDKAVEAALQLVWPEHPGGDDWMLNVQRAYEKEVRRFFKYSPSLEAMPGAKKAMRLLRDCGIHVAVVSDFDGETLGTVTDRLGWGLWESADVVFPCDAEGASGRKAGLVIRAMAYCGLTDGQEVVFVGTTPQDIAVSMEAGCARVFVVDMGASTFSDEALAGADARFSFPDEMVHQFMPRAASDLNPC